MSKIIIVTGAGRGLGTDIVREALAAGHQVVATGRRPEQVEKALGGPQDNLLTVGLDITNPTTRNRRCRRPWSVSASKGGWSHCA
jgi:NAD(P)-dependent dehydrogenase (short-subunit alcohol dehydrogenase family)